MSIRFNNKKKQDDQRNNKRAADQNLSNMKQQRNEKEVVEQNEICSHDDNRDNATTKISKKSETLKSYEKNKSKYAIFSCFIFY